MTPEESVAEKTEPIVSVVEEQAEISAGLDQLIKEVSAPDQGKTSLAEGGAQDDQKPTVNPESASSIPSPPQSEEGKGKEGEPLKTLQEQPGGGEGVAASEHGKETPTGGAGAEAVAHGTEAEKAGAEQGKQAADPPKELEPPNELPDEEIDAIKPVRGMSPAAQTNFAKLRQTAKHYKAELAAAQKAYDEKKAQLEDIITGKTIPENLKKEIEEARALRAKYEIMADPDFQSKYDGKIKDLNDRIIGICQKNGMPEEVLKKLKEVGIGSVPRDWWHAQAIEPLKKSQDPNERGAGVLLEKYLDELDAVGVERKQAIEASSKEFTSYAEEKAAKAKKAYEDEMMAVKAEADKFLKIPEAAFAVIRQVPKDATPEQKAEIEAHNKDARDYQSLFRAALFPANGTERAQVAAAVVLAHKFRKDNEILASELTKVTKEKDQQIAALREENARLKGAGKTKPGSPMSSTAGKSGKTDMNDLLKMKDTEAISKGLDELIASWHNR